MTTLAPERAAPSCLACHAPAASFWFEKNNCRLFRCRACGLIFMHPLPQETAPLYSDDYFQGATAGYGYNDYETMKAVHDGAFKKFLRRIEAKNEARGKLLDIGAATGTFIETAKKHGWEVTGVEISSYAAEQGRKKGLSIITGTIENAALPRAHYDVVTLWDVFEHVTNPGATLERIRTVLKPGGLIAMNMPDAGSWYARLTGRFWPLIIPPEHVILFNRTNLNLILNEHGFTPVDWAKIGKKFNPSYIFQVLYTVRYQAFWKKLAEIIKNTKLDSVYIPLNLRDNIFVIARLND